jgi:hypothetical protein
MSDDSASARKERIEARRRRLATRAGQHEWVEGDDESVPQQSISISPPKFSLSPVGEDDEVIEQGRQTRPAKMSAKPMNRTDHQETFGMRSSVAEGLVDAPTRKPAKERGAEADAGATADNLDLDFASIERARARMKRSIKVVGAASAEDSRTESSAVLAHKAAVHSADQANRPNVKNTTAAAGAAKAAAEEAGLTYPAAKSLITDAEESALHRLMIGPREEADGVTAGSKGSKNAAASAHRVAGQGVVGEEGINAIDAKAMDRLSRQNNELRKLAEAQRRELLVSRLSRCHNVRGMHLLT